MYAIGIVKDRSSDTLRLRIAKGRVKGYTKRTPDGVLEVYPDNPLDPITQPNRLNIKTAEEWQQITRLVEKWLSKIPSTRPPSAKPKEQQESEAED